MLGYFLFSFVVLVPLLQVDFMIYLSLIAVFTEIFVFGVVVWFAWIRSWVLRAIALLLPLLLQLLLLFLAIEYQSSSVVRSLVVLAGIAAIFGLLITRNACRFLFVAELE